MNKIIKIIMVSTAALLLISSCGCTKGNSMRWTAPPEMQLDLTKKYTAVFDTTFGSFEIELFATTAPITVNNFVFLARQGFYNNTVFHRISKEFVIQGGDPGTGILGTGGPGYTIEDELQVMRPYDPGIVAMANHNEPNTGGSQFFVCTGYRASGLDSTPTYTQFGRISSGMDIVLKIAAAPVVLDSQGEMSRPLNPPKINKVTIIES